MKIALCHFRVGETDGVSLEMDKWKKALEELGHQVIYIAGSAGNCDAELIPSLHYQNPINNRIVENAYQSCKDYDSEKALEDEVYRLAEQIESDLIRIIHEQEIELIVPNNILSLGWGLSAGIAFDRAIAKTGVKAICHHHDFHWERELYSNPKVKFVDALLKKHFPSVSNQIKHVCINQIAKEKLKQAYAVEADVVPNVFDFDRELIVADDYNADLRKEFGINPDDLVFVQATRVVERKAIELSIDLLAAINSQKDRLINKVLYKGIPFSQESEIYLVLAGKNESPSYHQHLQTYAKQKNVKILDISSRVNHQRKLDKGTKIYSLWDVYSIADVITYPSILEGWGNQFLEALVAKVPVAVYKYPVYLSDIESFGFDVISLGSEHVKKNDFVKIKSELLEQAADESIKYVSDPIYRKERVEKNYKKAKENLSVDSLRMMLKEIFKDGTN